MTEMKAINMNQLQGTVFRENEMDAEIQEIQNREGRELLVSILYNVLFWIFVLAGIVLLVTYGTFADEFTHLAAGIVSFCAGFIAYTLNIGRFGDGQKHRCSVVKQYLENSMNKQKFIRKMQRRSTSDVKLMAKLSMKENVLSVSKEQDHWSKKHRGVTREISYGSCAGKAFDVRKDVQWPLNEGIACRIIVRKSFKVRDEISKIAFKSQAEDFCTTYKFQENKAFLNFEYLLGFTNEKTMPALVETYLIVPPDKHHFYNLTVYEVFKLLSADSIYRLLFKSKTHNLGVFEIEKTIKHFESQA